MQKRETLQIKKMSPFYNAEKNPMFTSQPIEMGTLIISPGGAIPDIQYSYIDEMINFPIFRGFRSIA